MLRIVASLALTVALIGPCFGQVIRTSPPKAGSSLIHDGDVVDVFVDERGQIYKELRYHGIIPNIRDWFRGRKPHKAGKTTGKTRARRRRHTKITWVGFQQKQFYSRIFIQTDQLTRFTLHKTNPREIVIDFEGARLIRRNDRRAIITRAFSSSVDHIQARQRGRHTQVTIALKKPVGYLYKQQQNYVFIDVEK